jgi:hypothetical protein
MGDNGTCHDSVSSRSLANPRRVRVLTAYRDGQTVGGLRRVEQHEWPPAVDQQQAEGARPLTP